MAVHMAKNQILASKLQARVNKLETERKNLQMETEELKTKLESCSKSILMKEEDWEALENSVITMMTEISKLEALLEAKNKEIDAQNETHKLQASEIELLKNAVSLGEEARKKKQGEECLKKKKAIAEKVKEMEESRNFFKDQFEKQKNKANTVTATLRVVQKKMQDNEMKCQDTLALLKNEQDQNSLLKKEKEEWLKKERVMTVKLKEKVELGHFFEEQFKQQRNEVNNLEAALKEARQQLMKDKMYLVEREDQNSLLKNEKDELLKKEKVMKVKQKREVNNLEATLKEARQQLNKFEMCLQEKEAQNSLLMNEKEEWLKNESVMTVKLKEMEEAEHFFKDQSEHQKMEANTLKAALKEAQQQLEEDTMCLLEKEAQNSLLKNEKEEWLKKEKVMTAKLKEMEKGRHFFGDQSEQQKKEVNTLKAALKGAQQQLEATQVKWEKEKSSLLQQTEAQINLLKKKEEEWLKNERAMISKFKAMGQDWKESMTTITLLKKKLKKYEALLKDNEDAAHKQIVTVDKSPQTGKSLQKQKQVLDRTESKNESGKLSKSSAANDVQQRWPQNEAEQQVENNRIHGKRKKSSQLQEKDALNETLNEIVNETKMEHRWPMETVAVKSQLENHESYKKKQKKKKWYKKFLPSSE
ncbi:CAP-Gly domain-containing linker protein 1-like [Antennarius striatus]|uniref:CAP-Gly domain-containing linker protein 1-like n=1 Tax=Antennarius striatus TaxID=241820 RepID=UPI0035B0B03E